MIERNKEKMRRRRSVFKLIVINEEELIRQVSQRPGLFDRSLRPFRKHSVRQQCWREVSEAMEADIEECRKRWRSLRDTFVKHYKQVQSATDERTISRHRKWVYYDKMLFLVPHLDNFNSLEYDNIMDEIGDNSEDAKSISCESRAMCPSVEDIKNFDKHHVEDNANVSQVTPSLATSTLTPIAKNKNDTKSSISKEGISSHQIPSKVKECSASKICVQSVETNTDNNNSFLMESDEKFLLSCAPALRRLTTRQNALARLKIQQILFEIEFED